MDRDAIIAASQKHDIVPGRTYKYGTAGFRMSADLLDGVTFRVGLLAALRSRKLGGQAIGVMITASHNPAVDNGVKIVDPMGDMLEQDWEALATKLVNAPSHEELADTFSKLADSRGVTNACDSVSVLLSAIPKASTWLTRLLVSSLGCVAAILSASDSSASARHG